MNDIIDQIECDCLLYADDLKIFKIIEHPDDCLKLQTDLDSLSAWSKINCMELNVNKCKILTVSKKKHNLLFDYVINDVALDRVDQMKDLGIYIDRELRFDYHINYIKNRAFKMLGFVTRTLRDFNDVNCFKSLYCSFVRSVLEYASPVWSPHYNVYIEMLEKVQRRFLRLIAFKLGLPVECIKYKDIEKVLNLQPLQTRRTQFDILTLFKIVNNMIRCPELLSQVSLHVPQRMMRVHEVFFVQFHRTNYGMFSPLTRLCRLANDYCHSEDFFNSTLGSFKLALERNGNSL